MTPFLKGDFVPIWGHEEHLAVLVRWRLGPSSNGQYLRTEWSQYGFYVWGRKSFNPLIRLEVEAESDPDAWNVAHLQVTGVSSELGQVWGIRKVKDPKALQRLHLPVGGFRYRPCLEDFVEFLIEENLASGKDQWRSVLDKTREGYRMTQFRTLIADNPEEAMSELRELGHPKP